MFARRFSFIGAGLIIKQYLHLLLLIKENVMVE